MKICLNRLTTLAALRIAAAGDRLTLEIIGDAPGQYGLKISDSEGLIFYRDQQLASREVALRKIGEALAAALAASNGLDGDLSFEEIKILEAALKNKNTVVALAALAPQPR